MLIYRETKGGNRKVSEIEANERFGETAAHQAYAPDTPA